MKYLCQFCQKETINIALEEGDNIWQDCINCCNQNITVRSVFNNYNGEGQIEYLCMGFFFEDMPYSIDVWPEYKGTRPPLIVIYHHTKGNLYPYNCNNFEIFERKEIFSSHNVPNINPNTIKEKLKTYLIFF